MKRASACALLLLGGMLGCGSSAAPKSPGPVVVTIGGDAGAPPTPAADKGDAGGADTATAEGEARHD